MKSMWIILILLFFLFVAAVIALLLVSPGRPEPVVDAKGDVVPGSISEKLFVDIGGVKQGMFIRSRNPENPVLLYVHGGPAFPNFFLFEKYKPRLEDYFTVCYWEQRGGGLSYSKDVPLESMTYNQLVSDALEVTNYLRKRFNKTKIYLMAHSGGTPIAIQAAAEAPVLFHAYIAMAQITNQAESERIAWRYMVNQYQASGNRKALKELQKFPLPGNDRCCASFFKSMIRDKAMHDLGIGTMRTMKSVFKGVFIPVWTCRAYTVREKMNIWKSKISFIKKAHFVDQLFEMDIPEIVPRLEIPVYFFSGKYDLTVNVDLSWVYFKKLEAPEKHFYLFEYSAHSPLFEEPERVREIVEKEVLGIVAGGLE